MGGGGRGRWARVYTLNTTDFWESVREK